MLIVIAVTCLTLATHKIARFRLLPLIIDRQAWAWGIPVLSLLVPGAGIEPTLTYVKRILSSKFAQNETIAHNRTPIRSTSYVARVCLLLSNIEYAMGQIWDKNCFW